MKTWRNYLTPDETSVIADLDAKIVAARAADADATAQREAIRRRATGRMKREERKGG